MSIQDFLLAWLKGIGVMLFMLAVVGVIVGVLFLILQHPLLGIVLGILILGLIFGLLMKEDTYYG